MLGLLKSIERQPARTKGILKGEGQSNSQKSVHFNESSLVNFNDHSEFSLPLLSQEEICSQRDTMQPVCEYRLIRNNTKLKSSRRKSKEAQVQKQRERFASPVKLEAADAQELLCLDLKP